VRIAVAGATGRVGHHAVAVLAERGHDVAEIVASAFDEVEAQRWDGKFFPLQTREEVRAYCRHNFIPAGRAERVAVPLWLTKRGVLVRAARPHGRP
jgi:nucleoside-diphosphate-sugar epimerase